MKAKINGIEFEGTPSEFKELMNQKLTENNNNELVEIKPKHRNSRRVRANTEWTEEERQKMMELYNSGVSIRQIAMHLSRTKCAVNTQISILRKKNVISIPKSIQKSIWTKEEELYLKDMYSKGISTKEIAKVLNRTPHAVDCKISTIKNNQKPVKKLSNAFKRVTPEERQKIKEMHDMGKSLSEIGKELGRTTNAIRCQLVIIKKGGYLFPSAIKRKENKKCKRWTQTEKDIAIQDRRNGATIKEIARRLNRTEASITIFLSNMRKKMTFKEKNNKVKIGDDTFLPKKVSFMR